MPAPGRPLPENEFQKFVEATARQIARELGLKEKGSG
jgi:hypothetical protein